MAASRGNCSVVGHKSKGQTWVGPQARGREGNFLCFGKLSLIETSL